MSSGKPETKNKILKASLDLLVANQGGDVRMIDIAKRAGVSRQALYLHFSTRVDLLVATTHYLDDKLDMDARLKASRMAKTGTERLEAYIAAWCNYLPDIYSIVKALLVLKDTDDAAKDAWDERMNDMREGCAAAINALKQDNILNEMYDVDNATDILWMMLSVRNWELLTIERTWAQETYTAHIQQIAKCSFIKQA